MTDGAIQPDDKDWTWVLDRPCPECGFDAAAIDVSEVGALLRENTRSWAALLGAPADELRRRSRPDRWSTLEYAAHVRDVHRLFMERLRLMLTADDPLFANWNQDETAVAGAYNDQEPAVVAAELGAASAALASAYDGIDGEQWQRRGRRSDGALFTVERFARYFIHDPIHHLWDVQGGDRR